MNVIANCTQGYSVAVVEYLLPNLKVEVHAHPVLKYFSVTPPENSGVAENSTQNSGPHAKNFFCSMYEMSQRYPVWVAENHVTACNSVRVVKMCKNAAWQRMLYADLIASSLFSSFFKRRVRSQILQCSRKRDSGTR
jgi:hypothetical protein